MRHKAFHIVNVHRSMGIVSDYILKHLGDKLRSRVHLYTSFDDFKAIDKKHLPKEYGGTVPLGDMIGKKDEENPCPGLI